MPLLTLLLAIALLSRVALAEGDWPMERAGLLRANRAKVAGNLQGAPREAWSVEIGRTPPVSLTADLDLDGEDETYSAESATIVRRDAAGNQVWQSRPMARDFALMAFEDLDGSGRRLLLMSATGINRMVPLYFVFDPETGEILWEKGFNASNGGEVRLGPIDPDVKGIQLLRALFPNPAGGELHLVAWDEAGRGWMGRSSGAHLQCVAPGKDRPTLDQGEGCARQTIRALEERKGLTRKRGSC